MEIISPILKRDWGDLHETTHQTFGFYMQKNCIYTIFKGV